MSNLDALLEISKIARMLAGSLLYRRLLSNMAVIMLLIVITGMLAGALLIGGFYAGYLALLRHGFDTDAAALIVSSIMASAIALSVMLTLRFIRKLRNALIPIPAIPRVHRIASAFVDGFADSDHKGEHLL